MNSENKKSRLAVFIDADNASPKTVKELFTKISELGTVVSWNIYGNNAGIAGWKEVLKENHFEARQVQEGKNTTDIVLVIEAMKCLYEEDFDGFCIVSSDRDFAPLAAHLRKKKKTVYGFGKSLTSSAFQKVCTNFFIIESDRLPAKTGTAAPKSKPAPQEKKAPPLRKAAVQTKEATEKATSLYDSLKDKNASEKVNLSEFGTELKKIGIDYKQHKNKHGHNHRSLSKFLAAIGFEVHAGAPPHYVCKKSRP